MVKNPRLSGLYGVSGEFWFRREDLALRMISEAIDGGMRIFQLRQKSADMREILPFALRARELCAKNGVIFIVNDSVELAQRIEADGVHIGRDDGEISMARRIIGADKIIGVSCYGELSRALEAKKNGASYVAFGSCFESKTKPNAPVSGTQIFARAKVEIDVPLCAIGGICADNIGLLKAADMVAVISSLWSDEIGITRQNAQNLIRTWRDS